jgi:hypothetical protein
MLSETIRDRFEWTTVADDFQLTISPGREHKEWLLYRYLFIHYDPLWSSSSGFGGDYQRNGPALKNSPTPN